MNRVKEFFRLPAVENIEDYKRPAGIAVIAVFYVVSFLMVTYAYNVPGTMVIALIEQLAFLVILGFLYRKVLLRDIKVFKDNLGKYIPHVILWFIVVFLANTVGGNITKLLINNMGAAQAVTNESAVSSAVSQSPLIGALVVVALGPFVEELVFRRSSKIIFKNKVLFYLISALLFGAGHIIMGFTFPASFIQIIPYFLMGLALAAAYDRSNNIWCSIIPHVLSNATASIITAMLT